jgi:hypothetical protein
MAPKRVRIITAENKTSDTVKHKKAKQLTFHDLREELVPDTIPVVAGAVAAVNFIATGNEEWEKASVRARAQTVKALERVLLSSQHFVVPYSPDPLIPKLLADVRVVMLDDHPLATATSDAPQKRHLEMLQHVHSPEPFDIKHVNFNRVPGVLYLKLPMLHIDTPEGVTSGEYICARFVEDLIVHLFETNPTIVYAFIGRGAVRYVETFTQLLTFKENIVGYKEPVGPSRMLAAIDKQLEVTEARTDKKNKKKTKTGIYHAQIKWRFAAS